MSDQLPLNGKEPWEMTAEEYLAHLGINAGAAAIQRAHNRHSEIVYEAIRTGRIPPPEVLREYPTAAALKRCCDGVTFHSSNCPEVR